MMANAQAGETTLTVDGKNYTLRLDFRALAAIEDRLGSILRVLTENFERGQTKFSDLAVILEESLRSGGLKRITFEGAGELMLKAGLGQTATAIQEMIAATFEVTPEKPKAPARKTGK